MTQLRLLPDPPPVDRAVERYRCACGCVDTEGGPGPRMLAGEPGAYGCASSRWWCRACLVALRDALAEAAEVEERVRFLRALQPLPFGAYWLPHDAHARLCARLAV